jgi:transposase
MSKARLVITAIEVEGRSPAEVVAAYGVFRSWVYELLARYRAEGDAAFEPRSRRPHRCPAATPAQTVEVVLRIRKQLSDAGLDAGAETIGWHLTHHHRTTLSRAIIHRILTRSGAVIPEPAKTAQGLLPALSGRDAERDLAVGRHPLPAGHRRRHRDHQLAG